MRAAQRLRHQVFAGELGARLDGPEPGLDSDAFDAYCDHLLVREAATGDVVATYRLLPPERARIAGRLYSESEFDLGRLGPIRDDLVEVGRSCVHPAHRDGAVIALIWAGLARYMERSGHNWLAGCCSIPLADGGVLAADYLGHGKDEVPGPRGVLGHPAPPLEPRPRHPPPQGRTELPAAAPRLPAARRLGLRCARARPGLRRRRPLRPAVAAPHRPALSAPLPLARPADMSVWLPTAPCTPQHLRRSHRPAARPAPGLGPAGRGMHLRPRRAWCCVPAVLLLGQAPAGPVDPVVGVRRWCARSAYGYG